MVFYHPKRYYGSQVFMGVFLGVSPFGAGGIYQKFAFSPMFMLVSEGFSGWGYAVATLNAKQGFQPPTTESANIWANDLPSARNGIWGYLRRGMSLTDTEIKRARPQDKAYRLSDERGLYLLVTAAGGKLWRWKYRFQAKEKLMPLGKYPDVPLAKAR